MTGLAISLVLGAALVHASWNYLLKKSGGGIGFVWAFAALSSLLYAPLAIGVVIVQHFELTAAALALIFASAVLHTAYYLLLDRGYRHGDLSVVYPLAGARDQYSVRRADGSALAARRRRAAPHRRCRSDGPRSRRARDRLG